MPNEETIPLRGGPRGFARNLLTLLAGCALLGCGGGNDGPEEGAVAESVFTPRRPDMAYGQKVSDQLWDERLEAAKGQNSPPQARMEVLPPAGWAGLTTFTFDASLSTDDIDRSNQLRKRWDLDGDGDWDIPFTSRPRVERAFEHTGVIRPRLLVQDRGGELDSITGDPIEIRPACPPPEFALADVNPNSRTFGQTFSLAAQRGRRVLVWYATPSK